MYSGKDILDNLASLIPENLRPPVLPRWKKCVAENELQHAVAHAFVQKHFPDIAKSRVCKRFLLNITLENAKNYLLLF